MSDFINVSGYLSRYILSVGTDYELPAQVCGYIDWFMSVFFFFASPWLLRIKDLPETKHADRLEKNFAFKKKNSFSPKPHTYHRKSDSTSLTMWFLLVTIDTKNNILAASLYIKLSRLFCICDSAGHIALTFIWYRIKFLI